MSACATSGFGTKNTSVAFYDSAMIDMVLIFAMGISGIHFGLIYATVTGKRNNIFRSEVTLFYLGMLILGSLLIALSLYIADIYPTFRSSLRFASFQFVSVTSTSGFATADSSLWTPFAIILLILGSLICACAGSTSGGMKANRALMALKMLYIRVKQQQHPNAVIRLKMDGVIQEAGVLHTVSLFIVAYLLLILIGTILCTLFGVDLMTSFSGCVASIGNVGPGFGGVNSMANYGDLPAIVKFYLHGAYVVGTSGDIRIVAILVNQMVEMMWHKLLIGLFLTFSVVIVRGASDPAGPGIPALQSNSEYVALRDQDSRLQVRIDEMQTRIAGLRAMLRENPAAQETYGAQILSLESEMLSARDSVRRSRPGSTPSSRLG